MFSYISLLLPVLKDRARRAGDREEYHLLLLIIIIIIIYYFIIYSLSVFNITLYD